MSPIFPIAQLPRWPNSCLSLLSRILTTFFFKFRLLFLSCSFFPARMDPLPKLHHLSYVNFRFVDCHIIFCLVVHLKPEPYSHKHKYPRSFMVPVSLTKFQQLTFMEWPELGGVKITSSFTCQR